MGTLAFERGLAEWEPPAKNIDQPSMGRRRGDQLNCQVQRRMKRGPPIRSLTGEKQRPTEWRATAIQAVTSIKLRRRQDSIAAKKRNGNKKRGHCSHRWYLVTW